MLTQSKARSSFSCSSAQTAGAIQKSAASDDGNCCWSRNYVTFAPIAIKKRTIRNIFDEIKTAKASVRRCLCNKIPADYISRMRSELKSPLRIKTFDLFEREKLKTFIPGSAEIIM